MTEWFIVYRIDSDYINGYRSRVTSKRNKLLIENYFYGINNCPIKDRYNSEKFIKVYCL